MAGIELRTERLRLRRWQESDRAPFAALNADPVVMELFPAPLSADESNAFADRIEQHFDAHGYGLWAVELRGTDEFIGFVGLWPVTFAARFTPATEVGWRLARRFWGTGLAPEAAAAATADGFDRLGLEEIVSFTAAINLKSRRVMEKIGMTRDEDEDFGHPSVAEAIRSAHTCSTGWRPRSPLDNACWRQRRARRTGPLEEPQTSGPNI